MADETVAAARLLACGKCRLWQISHSYREGVRNTLNTSRLSPSALASQALVFVASEKIRGTSVPALFPFCGLCKRESKSSATRPLFPNHRFPVLALKPLLRASPLTFRALSHVEVSKYEHTTVDITRAVKDALLEYPAFVIARKTVRPSSTPVNQLPASRTVRYSTRRGFP